MRVLFAGNKGRGVVCLQALLTSGYNIVSVLAHPSPEKSVTPGSVAEAALQMGLPLLQPANVNAPEVITSLHELAPDLIVLAGYGQIVKQAFIDMASLGCINLHGGKLPQYRGSSPMNWALLNGERLVPPPPLPPDVFTTAEVERIRPAIREASRNWEQLDAEFKQRLLLVFKLMRDEHGYEMALLEGYRSPERQARLAALGSNVTQAGAYHSYHQYGLAADCAFYREGKLVISEKDPWAMRGYELYGQIAESAGLTWGGRWKMMDLGHVELRRAGVLGKKPAP